MLPFQKLKIALISDALTQASLALEAHVKHVTPLNYFFLFRFWKPDLLLVESAWEGKGKAWKYRIASYPDHPKKSTRTLAKVVACARDLGIPTVFWNKEDGVHFDRFIASAKMFDHVLTVDENCLEKYRALMRQDATVDTLLFAVQPATHHFSGFNFRHLRANFVGSYSHHVHERRRQWQNMFFDSATATGLGLTVFDRNSHRPSANYRFPELSGLRVHRAVEHRATAQIYKDYLVSLNVNTVEDSTTMFSRRLVEILACGGICVTNPTPSVERYFRNYCQVVNGREEANELFARLKYGPSTEDLERAEAGAQYVFSEHTWAHRLEKITQIAGV